MGGASGHRLRRPASVSDSPHEVGGWLSIHTLPADEVGPVYTITATDDVHFSQTAVDFNVYNTCLVGSCDCTHYIGGARSQLLPCRMFAECFCRGDRDEDWAYLMYAVIFGINVIDKKCDSEYRCVNYSSATEGEGHKFMTKRLKHEIEYGVVSVVDHPPICIHALGTTPKAGGVGLRAIVDCSSPANICVNEFTEESAVKFSYNSVDTVTDILQDLDYISTLDISDAYRAIATHPSSRLRQGLQWEFAPGEVTYMVDNRLSMGLSSSPYAFSKVSDFAVRCMVREGYTGIINYLDDFAIVAHTYDKCAEAQLALLKILRRIGFYISYKKLISPKQISRFLGIEIDTIEMKLRLPKDKMVKLHSTIQEFVGQEKARKDDLDRLAGLLSHCAKVVRGGRVFTRRIYDLCASVSKPFYKVRLSAAFQKDLQWWLEFADFFNGECEFFRTNRATLATYSDSSTGSGFGAIHNNDGLAGGWFEDDKKIMKKWLGHHYCDTEELCYKKNGDPEHINVLEMWPVLQAANRWGHLWGGADVCMVTDNTQVRGALLKGRSKNAITMEWLRRIFWLSVVHNFNIVSIYIPSEENNVCDALSRLVDPRSIERLKEADPHHLMCCSYEILSESPFATSSARRADNTVSDVDGQPLRAVIQADEVCSDEEV